MVNRDDRIIEHHSSVQSINEETTEPSEEIAKGGKHFATIVDSEPCSTYQFKLLPKFQIYLFKIASSGKSIGEFRLW
jgi:hypothetical protein